LTELGFDLIFADVMKILVVDDDPLITEALRVLLTQQNYAVEVAHSGQSGGELIETFDYDLVLLDVTLPDVDGIQLCRQIREKGVQIPILLITSLDSGHDKALGLDAGADDYVVKPFEPEELLARVRALLRRTGSMSQPILQWGDLRLDPSACEATYAQQIIALTPKEYTLLELFLRNNRRVFSCGMILEHLWAYEEMPGEEAVRTHIKGLRQKLKAVGVPGHLIETVYGIGYRLNPKESIAQEQDSESDASPQSAVENDATTDKRHKALSMMKVIWEESKQSALDRIAVLEQAVSALQQDVLSDELRQQARREAHTLAGTLGTFGFTQGSELSRQIETLLGAKHPLSQEDAQPFQDWVRELTVSIDGSPASSTAPMVLPEEDQTFLLLIDQISAQTHQLLSEAGEWGLTAQQVEHLAAARSHLQQKSPQLILLDPVVASSPEDTVQFLADVRKQVPPIPVILYSNDQCSLEHPEFCHLGSQTILQKPLTTRSIFETLKHILMEVERQQPKILAIDDDPLILKTLRTVLKPWGIKVIAVEDPRNAWDTLAQMQPDLLLLDVEMPHLSGIELCQQIRSSPEWMDLPILFLTVHTNVEIINQVFAAGADDFISKPIAGPELVTRLIPPLERIRLTKRSEDYAAKFSHPIGSTSPTPLPEEGSLPQSLQAELQRQSAIAQFALAALKNPELPEVMDRFLQIATQTLGIKFGCLFEQLQQGNTFGLSYGLGWHDGLMGNTRIPSQDSVEKAAIASMAPIYVADINREPQFTKALFLRDYTLKSSLTIPIEGLCEPYGALTLYTESQRMFEPVEVIFVQNLAKIISGILEQHQNTAHFTIQTVA
jgi:DNA-binding response OmpR family regulator